MNVSANGSVRAPEHAGNTTPARTLRAFKLLEAFRGAAPAGVADIVWRPWSEEGYTCD